MSEFANFFKIDRQSGYRTTRAEFAAIAIFAILLVAQVTLVAQNRDILDAAA
jgi:hypothetical protein